MSILAFHRRLIGDPATEDYRDFYLSFRRGHDLSGWDDDAFLSTFVLSLFHAANKENVVLIVPKALEKKTLQAIQERSRRILRRFKGKPTPVKAYTDSVKRLRIAARFLKEDEEPPLWFSIGLGAGDPVPSWLRDKLWQKKN